MPSLHRLRAATLFLVLTASVSALGWSQSTPAAEASQLLALADKFLAEPFRYHELRLALLDSAEARPDVAITISAGVLPWLCDTDSTPTVQQAMSALLLGAFVAGNMRAQLATQHKGDQPYAGVRATLEVYNRIRERVRDYRIPVLEAWAELERRDSLGMHIDSIAADPPPDCAP